MKRLFLLTVPFFFFLFSCGSSKIKEGEVEYKITYPNTELSGFIQAILPEKMIITFKGTKLKSNISRGKMFATEIISNEKGKSLEMRLDFGDKLYYTILNHNDVKDFIASQPKYELSDLNRSDSLVGTLAKAYRVKGQGASTYTDAWFTTDFIPEEAYWFTSYAGTKGFPLVCDAERYGVHMHLEAVKFTAREVLETEFDRAPELVETSFKEYEAHVQELFDLLME